MAHEPAQRGAHLDTRRGLAGAQHDRDGTRALGVVDMDRQEAALVVMGVEERELLMPVHDIAGVVDIENDGGGLPIVGGHPRQRWQRTQVGARVGQPPASEFEGGINAQGVKIVGVFVAAGAIARMRARTCPPACA